VPITRSIRFSAEDIEVLRRLTRISDLGATGARLLLAAPVVSLLSSGNPIELAVTLNETNWQDIANGIKNIKRVAACTAMQMVLEHLEAGVPKPIGEARTYFEHLLVNCQEKCD
jgi:hypothetical protein